MAQPLIHRKIPNPLFSRLQELLELQVLPGSSFPPLSQFFFSAGSGFSQHGIKLWEWQDQDDPSPEIPAFFFLSWLRKLVPVCLWRVENREFLLFSLVTWKIPNFSRHYGQERWE